MPLVLPYTFDCSKVRLPLFAMTLSPLGGVKSVMVQLRTVTAAAGTGIDRARPPFV